MEILEIIIFIIIFFIYTHIYYHLKKNNDLEIIRIDAPPKDKLEKICNVRQPTIFPYTNTDINNSVNKRNLNTNDGDNEINIRDILDKNTESNMESNIESNIESSKNVNLYVPLSLKNSLELFEKDVNKQYISERNEGFLKKTNLINIFNSSDEYLRPPSVSKKEYDVLFGSNDACTPLQYKVNHRNYYYVVEGSVTIRLMPPISIEKKEEERDYNNFEFRTSVDIWKKEKNFIEIVLKEGEIIHIPAYWWYSIKYDKISTLCSFMYSTYMSRISIVPRLVMSFLQCQNTKKKTMSTIKPQKN